MVLFGRLVLIGLILEGYGFLKLFGNFIPTALNFAREVPILNKVFEVDAEIPRVTIGRQDKTQVFRIVRECFYFDVFDVEICRSASLN